MFDAPAHLSDRAKALWRSVVPSRGRSLARLAMIQAALEALDRADAAREAVAVSGMTSETKTTGAIHVHPLLRVERESRQQFAKIWGDLRLGFSPDQDGCSAERFLARQKEDSDDALAELVAANKTARKK